MNVNAEQKRYLLLNANNSVVRRESQKIRIRVTNPQQTKVALALRENLTKCFKNQKSENTRAYRQAQQMDGKSNGPPTVQQIAKNSAFIEGTVSKFDGNSLLRSPRSPKNSLNSTAAFSKAPAINIHSRDDKQKQNKLRLPGIFITNISSGKKRSIPKMNPANAKIQVCANPQPRSKPDMNKSLAASVAITSDPRRHDNDHRFPQNLMGQSIGAFPKFMFFNRRFNAQKNRQ